MTTVNADFRARHVGGTEKRKTHNVVPVHMRHENIHRRRAPVLLGQHMCAERSRATAHIADVVLVASQIEFNARRMTAKSIANGKRQFVSYKGAGFQGIRKMMPRRFQ